MTITNAQIEAALPLVREICSCFVMDECLMERDGLPCDCKTATRAALAAAQVGKLKRPTAAELIAYAEEHCCRPKWQQGFAAGLEVAAKIADGFEVAHDTENEAAIARDNPDGALTQACQATTAADIAAAIRVRAASATPVDNGCYMTDEQIKTSTAIIGRLRNALQTIVDDCNPMFTPAVAIAQQALDMTTAPPSASEPAGALSEENLTIVIYGIIGPHIAGLLGTRIADEAARAVLALLQRDEK